ncbi:MAG: AMP-dependent synthetase [Candidatus Anoxymicrobium japonicum]|uniref:AMP-dependent synthetase n=1 Tax=Candidatus Anoxymicrobium japonicum TaxID=2013648 RepID=A0A2N3G5K3_9ACTN|nr:MAG: AMP-dependent synthetase [Candidatus Anoxymicrobium japonicum]
MTDKRFWTKSYDPGMVDLDPALWETTYVEAVKPTFEKYSDEVALAFMGVEVTFGELDRYANRFADMLIANGLKKGDVIGLNLPNIPEYVIAWLGTLRAGGVISGVSPLLSAEEMEYQLKDSNARGLVTLDAIFEKRLLGIIDNLPDLKIIATTSVGSFLPAIKRTLGKLLKKIPKGNVAPLPRRLVFDVKKVVNDSRYSTAPPDVKITPDDIACIQYTGGTTGSPKGALLSHRNVVSDLLIVQRWLGWEEVRGVALSGFPFFHIAGLFFNANCIYLGWTQVLIANPRDTDHICKEIVRYKPTALVNVPSLFQMLLANPKFKELDHSNLDKCISAASPFPEESQKELEKVVGEEKLLEVYGMTETSPLTVMNPSIGKKKLGAIGLPLINTDIRLIDTDTGKDAVVGEPGEICVKGPQVMIGYYNKPEETALVFDEEGYLHTGDVAIQDEDGYLRIVDRTKDMIIVSGFKVFSKRVEEILCEHLAIDMVALIGVPNPQRPGSELVLAIVTICPDYNFDGDEEALKSDILKMAKDRLTPYEVPKKIEIRQELPLTAIGKVDKKVLRKEVR